MNLETQCGENFYTNTDRK